MKLQQGLLWHVFLGKDLRQKIPNSVDRSVNGKEFIKLRREARERRFKKKERTEEKKLVFSEGYRRYLALGFTSSVS